MEQLEFICEEQQPTRLDKLLTEFLPDYSRSALSQLIADGMVQLNGKQAAKVQNRKKEIFCLFPCLTQ